MNTLSNENIENEINDIKAQLRALRRYLEALTIDFDGLRKMSNKYVNILMEMKEKLDENDNA